MAPVDVIAQCWARIHQYIDVISLILVSKSCRPLRDLVVDDATGKIKASVVRINNTIDVDGEGNIVMASPPARIFQYVPRLINSIHFPSLRRLKIGFPPNVSTWNGRRVVDEHGFPEAFPLFVVEVENATNLEELEIDVSSLIVHEDAGALQSSFQVLRDNLSFLLRRTRKLERLTLINEVTFDHGAYSKFSSAFLAAMVRVIRACPLSLEHVTVLCGDIPSCRDFPNVGREFFEAILNLQKLKTLKVQIQSFYGPLLNDFVDAARSIHSALGTFPSDSLERVDIHIRFLRVVEGQQLLHSRPSIAPFLSLFHDARNIRELRLWLPPECWDANSIVALGPILNATPSMDQLSLHFCGYTDRSGRLNSYISHFVEERKSSLGPRVHLLQLGCCHEESESFNSFRQYIKFSEHEGGHFWQFESDKSFP